MNERIKELAVQSGLEELLWIAVEGSEDAQAVEKFAELILKDCFNIVIGDSRFHDSKNIINAAKTVAMEHFGVE